MHDANRYRCIACPCCTSLQKCRAHHIMPILRTLVQARVAVYKYVYKNICTYMIQKDEHVCICKCICIFIHDVHRYAPIALRIIAALACINMYTKISFKYVYKNVCTKVEHTILYPFFLAVRKHVTLFMHVYTNIYIRIPDING